MRETFERDAYRIVSFFFARATTALISFIHWKNDLWKVRRKFMFVISRINIFAG